MSIDKKLLYISSRVFWPPMGGHEVEIYHYCRGLHEKYGYTVDVYAFDSADKLDGVKQPNFLNKVILAKKIGSAEKVGNLLYRTLIKGWPIQNSLYYSTENAKEISSILNNGNYDVVIVDMIRLATYFEAVKGSSCKKILDIDDTLSKRYKRQLNAITENTNIAGQYHERLPGFLQKLLGSSFIKRAVLKFEIPRVEKAEKNYSDLYDKVIFVSPLETDEFNNKYHTDKAVTVSLGVDYPYFSEELDVEKCQNTATFVGNMATPANADSVRYIAREVIPKCRNLDKLICVGNCPNDLRNELKDNKKVVFTGKVDDLRSHVKRGIVFLAPIAYGTGIKTKILEAMAMEMPVITNSIGAEGIHAINGKHWYVSDDALEIAKYLDGLMENPELCASMGMTSKEFVRDYFQWDIIFEQFEKLGL